MKKNILSKELWVGFLGVVALLAIYLLINFFKGVNVFNEGNSYTVRFSNIGQIVKTSPVYLNGYKVGNVREIFFNYNNRNEVFVEIAVDDKLRLPLGSVAEIENQLLGSSIINLTLTNCNTFVEPGDTIAGRMKSGALDEASKMLPAVSNLLPKVDSILVSVNNILANPALTGTINNVEQLTAQLNSTSAELNKLLNGDIATATGKLVAIEDEMLELSSKLNEIEYQKIVNSLEASLSNIEQITAALNNGEGTAGMLLKDSTLYNKLNNTCEAATLLLEDLKSNPKRYVHFSVFGKKDKKEKK